MKLCNDNNLKLYQIFEHQWKTKKDIWLSILSEKLNLNKVINGYDCNIMKLNNIQTSKFLMDNHLSGKCNFNHSFGLYYNNELVSCLCIKKSLKNKNFIWEILRYCNKNFITINNGFEILLGYFYELYKGSFIIYDNLCYDNLDLYNFKVLNITKPNCYYFKPSTKRPLLKHLYNKNNIKIKEYNDNKNLYENMIDNGYRRFWDCGNIILYRE